MSNPTVSFFGAFLLFTLLSSFGRTNGSLLGEGGRARAREYGDNQVTTTETDFFHFKTRPDIRALKWHIIMNDEDALAPGFWFIAPYELLGQKERGAGWVGPHIYDGKGDLVWSGVPLFDSFNIFDFRPIKINGEDMLTAIYKRADAGVILDNSFRIRKMIHWPGGYDAANMHEFTVFDEGKKALMLTLEHHELSTERSKELGYDGMCNINTNGLLELDISTSPPKTLFSFSLLDHLSLDEITYPTKPGAERVKKECREGWDSNHCNAIDRFPNGDYLVSCRHTDTLYKISRDKAAIEWRLGGTRSDFEFLGEAKFSRQHHARIREHNETHTVITLFDNARGEGIETATHEYTRGLILSLHDNVAEMIAEYPRPDHEYTTSRGSLEIMPNGNVFIGWTFHSRISEHAPDGRVLMKAKLPPKMNTYRSYKAPWVGKPIDPPDVYAQAQGEQSTDVYVSWNGATEVKTWKFYSCTAQGENLQPLKSVAKEGFETSTKLEGQLHHLIAEAIDFHGNSLGRSRVIQTIPPDRNPETFVEEQKWYEKFVPANATYEPAEVDADGSPIIPQLWEKIESAGSHSTTLAYAAGVCTCVLAYVLYQLGLCLRSRHRRRKRVQAYTVLDKQDDPDDDDFELQSSGRESPVNGLQDGMNGRFRK